jgi:chromosome segregation ATPase
MSEGQDPIEQAAERAGLTQQDIVRSDIEQARAELAETVDALSDKLDIKARAGDKVSDAKAKLAETAARAKQAAPPPVQHALDVAGQKAAPVVSQVSQKAAPHRGKIIAGAVVAVVVLVVVRKRRARR